jgi:ribosome biogenesis protein MAK21
MRMPYLAVSSNMSRLCSRSRTREHSTSPFERSCSSIRSLRQSRYGPSQILYCAPKLTCFDEQETSDRFYRTLYESLLDPRLLTSSKQAMYLNLLFKAVKADTNLNRVMAFVKRLVQVMLGHQPPFICGALYLLGELFSTTTGLSTLVTEPEDSGIEHFVDAPDGDEKAKPVELPTGTDRKPEHEYDGRKRDPQHSNAKGSCLWELVSVRCP